MPFPLPKRAEPRIDLSPLIDVVFQLLIFFVVTTTFLSDTGIPLDLPEAQSGQEAESRREMSVRISADGAIHFEGKLVSLADLETLMRKAIKKSPQEPVTIYGDGEVDYETIVQVMDVARRSEAPGIVLATETPAAPD
ncbi:MAG: ExbD/TolR family protein [Acidobacteriota bacterium]